jgi:hypothetical protein
MAGARGWTETYRLSTNVRVAKYTALAADAVDTTQTALFAKQPAAASPWLTQCVGVTILNFFEPNFFAQQDTDPSTITGTTPVTPYVLGGTGLLENGPFLTVQNAGIARCYAASASSITSGSLVVVADQFGRVATPAAVGVAAGVKVFPVGTAMTGSTAINTVLLVNVNVQQTVA